jgi:hypothetical protein
MKEGELKAALGRATKKMNKGVMNGRALFTFNPDLFKDQEEEAKEEAKVDENLFAEEAGADEEVDFDDDNENDDD